MASGAKLDRNTISQDSGISQMSIGNDNVAKEIASLEEGMEDLTLRPNFKLMKSGGPRSLPYATVNGVTETDSNGFRSLGNTFHFAYFLPSSSTIFSRRNKRL